VATIDDIAAITRALNGVTTAGQARAAIGRTSEAISRAYKVADMLPSDRRTIAKRTLDGVRQPLDSWYREIANVSASAPFANDWAAKRRLIERAYIEIAGIEGEANYVPATSNLDILLTSIKEAPKVFGQAVGSVAKEVGATAGSVAGGVFKGLGFGGTLGLLVVVAVVVLVLTRGTVLGLLFRGRA
jgi:hypothetical protein